MRAVLNMLGFTSGGGLAVGLNMLTQLGEVAPNESFLVLLPNVPAYDNVELAANVSKRVFDVSSAKQLGRLWIDHVMIPECCRRFGANVLFSMSNFGPYRVPCAHVVGVHLGYLAYPQWPIWSRLSARDRIFLRAQTLYFAITAAHADRICVLTETVRERMARAFSLTNDRITVVPNASAPEFDVSAPDDPRVSEMIENHPAKVRLCYPALGYPHKNHEVLPEVIRILRGRIDIDEVVILVTIDAGDSANARKFISMVESQRLRSHIVNLGHLERPGVSTVYRHSQALLMPTLLESFSLSYLEAMRFGVPILTSEYDFAREVCGDAALYFDPLDPESIARAIARVIQEPNLGAELRERGTARLRQYGNTWGEVSEQYIRVLREVSKESRS